MIGPVRFLSPSEAAAHLGVSPKALRLYERRGLLSPDRTAAGWRLYGPAQMKQAAEVVFLRALGFSLAEVKRVMEGDAKAVAAHQAALEARLRDLSGAVERVRVLQAGFEPEEGTPAVAFALPWPWDGERFELRGPKPLTYIIGPLGSGKTRLAQRIAEAVPEAAFIGLVRPQHPHDAALNGRVRAVVADLTAEGAQDTPALADLLAALEGEGPAALVIDMVEQGLDQATQLALIAWLRRRPPGSRPLFLMTRSTAILDLSLTTVEEAIILCPANHNPPMWVKPIPGSLGYEAVATCLASPQVRTRTEGMVACMPAA